MLITSIFSILVLGIVAVLLTDKFNYRQLRLLSGCISSIVLVLSTVILSNFNNATNEFQEVVNFKTNNSFFKDRKSVV